MLGIEKDGVRKLIRQDRWKGKVIPCRWVWDNPRGAGWRARIAAKNFKDGETIFCYASTPRRNHFLLFHELFGHGRANGGAGH